MGRFGKERKELSNTEYLKDIFESGLIEQIKLQSTVGVFLSSVIAFLSFCCVLVLLLCSCLVVVFLLLLRPCLVGLLRCCYSSVIAINNSM